LDQLLQRQINSQEKENIGDSKLLEEILSLKEKFEKEVQNSDQLDKQISVL
jgi:hypothetical protein